MSLFEILKSDSSLGLRLRIILKMPSASPAITSRLTALTGITVMLKVIFGREKYCLAVVTGIKQTLSPLMALDPLLLRIPAILSLSPATVITFPNRINTCWKKIFRHIRPYKYKMPGFKNIIAGEVSSRFDLIS